MSKFLLLLGPSGVGKSAVIERLIKMDSRFEYISPYITRPLRVGETSKVSITDAEMDVMDRRGDFLVINKIYGIRYATPRMPIETALAEGRFPVLDWPVDQMTIMTQAFPGKLHIVYVLPPSMEVLKHRLGSDQRDTEGMRFTAALAELEKHQAGQYTGLAALEVLSEEGRQDEIAQAIYASYLHA